jgi:hypothetical protein
MSDKRGSTRKQLPIAFAGFLAICYVALVALGAGGCSRDPEQATVDFSNTVPVARPTSPSGVAAPLRGAVAARETFIHYQQLLAYLMACLVKPLDAEELCFCLKSISDHLSNPKREAEG